jgi:hypothetical protein
MSRQDISEHLIHFTRGITDAKAFKVLQKIIRDKRLIGSDNLIKGKHRCVCFSEAPLASLSGGLINEDYYSKYSPFGIMVSKKWLFERGGRPVIYQPVSQYKQLPESHRWRHMTFELRSKYGISDFTWEREWRIQCNELPFDHTTATIVVRDATWAARLVKEHDDDQEYTVRMYTEVIGDLAQFYRESFKWKVVTLQPADP